MWIRMHLASCGLRPAGLPLNGAVFSELIMTTLKSLQPEECSADTANDVVHFTIAIAMHLAPPQYFAAFVLCTRYSDDCDLIARAHLASTELSGPLCFS